MEVHDAFFSVDFYVHGHFDEQHFDFFDLDLQQLLHPLEPDSGVHAGYLLELILQKAAPELLLQPERLYVVQDANALDELRVDRLSQLRLQALRMSSNLFNQRLVLAGEGRYQSLLEQPGVVFPTLLERIGRLEQREGKLLHRVQLPVNGRLLEVNQSSVAQ